MIYIFKST